MIDKPHKVFVEAGGRNSFWMKVVKKFKVAAFSPLVLKSNFFEKIKCTHKKEILLNFFNIRKRMLIRFVDIEISYHK